MHGLAFFVEKIGGTELELSLDHACHPFQGGDRRSQNDNQSHTNHSSNPNVNGNSNGKDGGKSGYDGNLFECTRALDSLHRAFVMCNHLSECDWLFICCLAARVQGALGGLRFVLKRSIARVPLVGWALQMLHFVFIDRCWRTDEAGMGATLQQLRACAGQQDGQWKQRSGFWLAIFPEGTDFTERKRDACQEFARARGLPVLQHVLLPRTRGTYLCLHSLHSVFDALIDVTVAYDKGKGGMHDLAKMAIGRGPRRVFLHLKLLPVGAPLALSQHAFNEAMFDMYTRKNAHLSHVYANGSMPFSNICSLRPPTSIGLGSLSLSLLMTMAIIAYISTRAYVWFLATHD
ncbi:unnamed protein product [Closterium sp. NIES-53]